MRNALSVSAIVVGLALAACSPETRNYGAGGGGPGGGGPGGGGGTGGNPSCSAGTDDCDAEPGCETNTTNDASNCGGCGVVCQRGCVEGVCDDPTHITAGYQHTCAITGLGALHCWGRNDWGELGNGGVEALAPAQVALSTKAVGVDGGGGLFKNAAGADVVYAHTCAVLDDTTVQCWGANSSGQLGIGQAGSRDTPATVISLVGAVSVSAGGRHTCAVTKSNELYCWGANDRGQVGIGVASPEVDTPEKVPLAGVREVSAGYEHTCAVLLDDTLHCWGGDGLMGPLGLGGGDDQPSPKVVSLTGVTQVSSGATHSCALKGGQQYCWGNGYQGQLGIKDEYTWRTTPTDPSELPGALFVAAAFNHTASIASDGTPWVTGVNVPLGNGTDQTTYVPVPVNLTEAAEIAGGHRHTCVLTKKGLLFCWGGNGNGQLGLGVVSAEDVLDPKQVSFP